MKQTTAANKNKRLAGKANWNNGHVLLLLVMFMFIAGCYYDNREDLYPKSPLSQCDTVNVTYLLTLKPIVDQQCATVGCHNGPTPSGWDLTDYEGLKTVATNGTLMPSLYHTNYSPMPKGLPMLDSCTLMKFQVWINRNMP